MSQANYVSWRGAVMGSLEDYNLEKMENYNIDTKQFNNELV